MSRKRKVYFALLLPLSLVLLAVAWAVFSPLAPIPEHPFFDSPAPWVIAHRGGRGHGPENTLITFGQAVEMGVDVLEMDVRRTSDGTLVVFHDEDVDRTTDGQGAIHDLTLGQVKALDAGYHWSADNDQTHPFRGQGIQVPTLDEVFEAFPNVRLNLEIKPRSLDVARSICQTIRSFDRDSSVLVASFSQEVMDAFRDDCPEVATSATFREVFFFVGLNRFFLGRIYRSRAEAFQVPPRAGKIEVLTPRFIRTAKRLNVRVQVWTVDEAIDFEPLLAMGVHGIMADYPDQLLKLTAGSRFKPDPPEKQ